MGFGKSLFDFVGYMSFFNPIGTGRASDALEKQDDFSEDVQDDSSEDESFSSDDFDDL
jgi:hypothetical protein